MHPGRSIIASILVLAAVVAATPVHAQTGDEASEASREEARALFVAGSAAVDAGRWADAVGSFERAYQLTRAPSALYNLALSLRALGRHREARDAFARLLGEHDVPEGELRSSAEQMRREEAARVAVLALVGLEEQAPTALRFDGRDVDVGGRATLELETDAGSHTLVAEREGDERFLWEGRLQDGERQVLRIAFPSRPAAGDDTALHVVLVVVGVAALAAGGGVLGWSLQESAQLVPTYEQRVNL
jgi:tetratricopeptide (TPR) repeat protein